MVGTRTAAAIGTRAYERTAAKLREHGRENTLTSERTVQLVTAAVTLAVALTSAFQAARSLRRAWRR